MPAFIANKATGPFFNVYIDNFFHTMLPEWGWVGFKMAEAAGGEPTLVFATTGGCSVLPNVY
jgi:hypothetical protein